MMEWKEVKLDSLVNRKICYGIVQAGPPLQNGVPIVKVQNIVQGLDDISSLDKTSDDISNQYKRTILKGGELLITLVGTVGLVDIAPKDFAGANIIRNVGLLDITDNNIKQWVKYYIMTREGQHYIMSNLNTTVQKALNIKELCAMPIPMPNESYMQKAVSILSSLDSKIETNNKINAKLEEMAQALFKSWFVDYEPFKDKGMVESELGMIPEGWRVCKISDLSHSLETGKRPKGGVSNITIGVPSVGADNVKGLGLFDYSKVKYVTEEFASKLKRGWVNGYELLIYKDGGTPGNYIPHFSIMGEGFPFDKFCLNEHVFKLDFGNRYFNAYSYFYFQTQEVLQYLNAVGGKAAIPGINQNNIEEIFIIEPNDDIRAWGEIVLPMITQILRNCKENSRLSQLRDTLLPKLMSGEIEL